MSLTRFSFSFTRSWFITLLSFLFIVLFIKLGFWQLARAHEKDALIQAYQMQALKAFIPWKAGAQGPLPYEKIKVEGRFLPFTVLLDNQLHDHQFGYDVLAPLQLEEGQVVLIDKGWISGDKTRRSLPHLNVWTEKVVVMGSAYYPSDKVLLLGENLEKARDKMIVIERIDPLMIGHFLHKSIYPFIIRLDSGQAHGFLRDWPVVSMSPERHHAYAAQWFALALGIFIMYLVFSVKKK